MNNKGSALLYTVLLLSILLTVVLGLSTLISAQFDIMKSTGNSVVAFYAADAGIERMLNSIVKGNEAMTGYSFADTLGNGASYAVQIFCKKSGGTSCVPTTEIPVDLDCNADNFCIKSVGTYKGVKRALMVTI